VNWPLQRVATIVAVVAIAACVTLSLGDWRQVEGGSMLGTLWPGDIVLIGRPEAPCSARFCSDSNLVGSIVAVRIDEGGRGSPLLVKRIAAVGGDTLWATGGGVYRNGHLLCLPPTGCLRGPHVWEVGSWHLRLLLEPKGYWPTDSTWGPVLLPPGSAFLVGDHLPSSRDSRDFGPVRLDAIVGQVEWRVPLGQLRDHYLARRLVVDGR